jgi:hypothetical protein
VFQGVRGIPDAAGRELAIWLLGWMRSWFWSPAGVLLLLGRGPHVQRIMRARACGGSELLCVVGAEGGGGRSAASAAALGAVGAVGLQAGAGGSWLRCCRCARRLLLWCRVRPPGALARPVQVRFPLFVGHVSCRPPRCALFHTRSLSVTPATLSPPHGMRRCTLGHMSSPGRVRSPPRCPYPHPHNMSMPNPRTPCSHDSRWIQPSIISRNIVSSTTATIRNR